MPIIELSITQKELAALPTPELAERLRHFGMLLHTTNKVNEEHFKTLQLKDAINFMDSEAVVKVTLEFLSALRVCCVLWHKPAIEVRQYKISAKVFLSMYVFRVHSEQLFRTKTPESDALMEANEMLLDKVEELKRMLVYGGYNGKDLFEKTKPFLFFFIDYTNKFNSWKAVEVAKRAILVKNHMLGLQGVIFRTAGEHGEVDPRHPAVIRIKEIIDRHITYLVQIAGVNEAFLFNKEVEASLQQRRQLRLLREEQRRNATSFDFVE